MRTVLILMAVLLCACAGLAPVNTHHNEQFIYGGEGEPGAVFKLSFGPDKSALKDMTPEAVEKVLLAYAEAAGKWLAFNFYPTWEQHIDTEIQGTASQEQSPDVDADVSP